MGRLVTEGTSVYEIDEECMREKERERYGGNEKKRAEESADNREDKRTEKGPGIL